MKKIFIFVLLLLLVPAICLAEPQVTSDKQTFNPFTGVYDLQGNVQCLKLVTESSPAMPHR